MTEDQKARASTIFTRPSATWTRDETAFLQSLFNKGHRDALKKLRMEVQLGGD